MAVKQDDGEDFVDRLAQAVIDKIEEQNQTTYLINAVARRVIELQKQNEALQEKAGVDSADADNPPSAPEDGTEKKDETNGGSKR